MEGVGSRLGRSSSRYGPSATAAVFNGPVRKWKKKWVHVGPSSSTSIHSNGHTNSTTNSRLLLWRWTPLSAATTTAIATTASVDTSSDNTPKRKFRYTPIAVLEERKKAAKKGDSEGNETGTNQLTVMEASKNDELNSDSDVKIEIQGSYTSNLDLGLCLKGHNSDHGECSEGEVKKASAGGFWTPN